MAEEVKSPELAKLNAELKSANVHITVQQLGDRLWLRGTFPPRPDSSRTAPHSQRIPLGVYANPAGLKRAKAEAMNVAADIAMGRFSWDKYLKPKQVKKTIGDWIQAYEKDYFTRRLKTPKSETTWDKDYRLPFARLPQGKLLTAEVLLSEIATTEPDSRQRKRLCHAYNSLAALAGIQLNVDRLRGKYSPKAVQPRDLPSDELIVEWRNCIPRDDWRWVYGMVAAYGLRPHEAFLIDPSSVRESPFLRILEGKTGYHTALPCLPEWWQDWQLWNVQIPSVTARQNRNYGERAGQYFRKLEMPFRLYDLRHAWAARVARMGLPDTIAAKMQGHSPHVHSQVYQQFMNDEHYLAAWELMRDRSKRLASGEDA